MTSTIVTASHVTQGRVDYESKIPRSMDEGLDLLDANIRITILNKYKILLIRIVKEERKFDLVDTGNVRAVEMSV